MIERILVRNFFQAFAYSTSVGLRNTFNISGKTERRGFWFFFLFFLIAYLCVWILDELFFDATVNLTDSPMGAFLPLGYIDPEVGLLVLMFRPIMAIPAMSATIRRLHDVGKSGWWSVLWVFPIPVLGWFWLVPLLLRPTKEPQMAN